MHGGAQQFDQADRPCRACPLTSNVGIKSRTNTFGLVIRLTSTLSNSSWPGGKINNEIS